MQGSQVQEKVSLHVDIIAVVLILEIISMQNLLFTSVSSLYASFGVVWEVIRKRMLPKELITRTKFKVLNFASRDYSRSLVTDLNLLSVISLHMYACILMLILHLYNVLSKE